MSSLTILLGKNIARYRESLNLTQGELAKLAGTSAPTISRYESGEAGISSDSIERIASALKVNEIDLVYGGDRPAPLRVVETRKEMIQRVDDALALVEIITSENTELILNADKATHELLVKGINHWMRLPHQMKGALVRATVKASDDLDPSLVQHTKLKA